MRNLKEGNLSIKFGDETFSLCFLNGIQDMNLVGKSKVSPKFEYFDFKRKNGKWSTSVNA